MFENKTFLIIFIISMTINAAVRFLNDPLETSDIIFGVLYSAIMAWACILYWKRR
ncbi:hypothetical protein ACFFUE_04850 [Bergeyella porcorum]|uniref:hypothetical protein n=1 Tax=Bergeyella porcorum TaxID=1735111 RepID=UPI0035E5543A